MTYFIKAANFPNNISVHWRIIFGAMSAKYWRSIDCKIFATVEVIEWGTLDSPPWIASRKKSCLITISPKFAITERRGSRWHPPNLNFLSLLSPPGYNWLYSSPVIYATPSSPFCSFLCPVVEDGIILSIRPPGDHSTKTFRTILTITFRAVGTNHRYLSNYHWNIECLEQMVLNSSIQLKRRAPHRGTNSSTSSPVYRLFVIMSTRKHEHCVQFLVGKDNETRETCPKMVTHSVCFTFHSHWCTGYFSCFTTRKVKRRRRNSKVTIIIIFRLSVNSSSSCIFALGNGFTFFWLPLKYIIDLLTYLIWEEEEEEIVTFVFQTEMNGRDNKQ